MPGIPSVPFGVGDYELIHPSVPFRQSEPRGREETANDDDDDDRADGTLLKTPLARTGPNGGAVVAVVADA